MNEHREPVELLRHPPVAMTNDRLTKGVDLANSVASSSNLSSNIGMVVVVVVVGVVVVVVVVVVTR
jgi:hypothetical protein